MDEKTKEGIVRVVRDGVEHIIDVRICIAHTVLVIH